jgi:hypothetical protein
VGGLAEPGHRDGEAREQFQQVKQPYFDLILLNFCNQPIPLAHFTRHKIGVIVSGQISIQLKVPPI